MRQRTIRSWVWLAIAVQLAGWVYDALWHGVLHPGEEPQTVADMTRHLATVHLPLYVGAVAVLITVATALLHAISRSAAEVALAVAFGGAVLSTGAEAWHAYSHLRLDTHSAPIAGTLSFVGFVGVVAAMWWSRGGRGAA